MRLSVHAQSFSGLVLLLAACGGAAASGGTTPTPSEANQAPSWTERATTAYTAGEFDAAWRASQNALQLDPADEQATEVAARVALSRLDADRALAALTRAHGPVLLRLRARAYAMKQAYTDVARDLAAVDGQEPHDGWAEAMLPLSQNASPGPYFDVSGAATAELPYQGEPAQVPIPIVAISIHGHATHALIATSASMTVVDDDLEGRATFLRDIAFGDMHVHTVPAFSRDLSSIENAVHMPIGAVIGTDLLLRLHATLDGPRRMLVVRTEAPTIPQDSIAMPLTAFEGTLLTARAGLIDAPESFFVLDSAGGFVLALSEDGVEAMRLAPADLHDIPNSPVPSAKLVDVTTFRFGGAAIEHVPGVTGLVQPDLVRLAGTRIHGVIGAQFLNQFQMTFDTEGHAIAFHIDAPDDQG